MLREAPDTEWLRTNRRGDYALGTISRVAHRRYHGLLTLREPPVGPPFHVLFDVAEWLVIDDVSHALHAPTLVGASPDDPRNGLLSLVRFDDATTTWTYRWGDVELDRSLELIHAIPGVRITYVLRGTERECSLVLRPVLSCRPADALTFANPSLDGSMTREEGGGFVITPYRDVPALHIAVSESRARYVENGSWIVGIEHDWDRERGYEHAEDGFTPGELRVPLARERPAFFSVSTSRALPARRQAVEHVGSGLATLSRTARDYLVRTGSGAGVIAGYPWFGEWARDTCIALEGLVLATADVDFGLDVLTSLADRRENGLVPNLPRSGAQAAQTESADASLLFVRCVDRIRAMRPSDDRVIVLERAAYEIVLTLASGGDPRIDVRDDGGVWLEPGPWAPTWMDARIHGIPVTPRHGFAIEICALFADALEIVSAYARTHGWKWPERLARMGSVAHTSLVSRYTAAGCAHLADGFDGDVRDVRLRPNQLFALASPRCALDPAAQRSALAEILQHLVVPVGVRSLAPYERGYVGRYEGDVHARDAAYHQGTAWPFLVGVLTDAAIRILGVDAARATLRPVFERIARHIDGEGCLGHVSEIFDGDAPHIHRGAPAQAWSVAEVYRAARSLGLLDEKAIERCAS